MAKFEINPQEEYDFIASEKEEYFEEYDDFDGDTMDTAAGKFVDRTGKTRSFDEEGQGTFTSYRSMKGNIDVFGMPLQYNRLDDPNGRAFNKTFIEDLPLVFIMPGKPKINKRLFGQHEEGGLFSFGETANRWLHAASQVAFPGSQNTKDGRFISISPGYAEYYRYLQTMASQLHVSMGLQGIFSLREEIEALNNGSDESNYYGLAYFGNKGTSISESASHEYTASTVASEVNSKNQEIREQRMLAEVGGTSMFTEITEGIKKFIDESVSHIPVLGGIVGNLLETLNGQKMYYPDLWTNSLFDRTYNLEFRFHSPYGDPESIFKYVYLPFMSLLVLALPLQDAIFSYKQPFMVRANSPGRFECEAGIIQSMNIIRGEEQTWTADGLPREIAVSINIRDLYPTMMASKNFQRLKYNKGLISYIDALAGVRYDQLSIVDKLSRDGQSRINEGMSTLKGNYFRNKASDIKYSINNARNIFG